MDGPERTAVVNRSSVPAALPPAGTLEGGAADHRESGLPCLPF